MQPSDGMALIMSTVGLIGSLFALLSWLRTDLRREVMQSESRIMREIDHLAESSEIISERLSECLTSLVQIETEFASAKAEIAIMRDDRRRERSPHARPIT